MDFLVKTSKKLTAKTNEFIIFVAQKDNQAIFSKHLSTNLKQVVQQLLADNSKLAVDKKIVCLTVKENNSFLKMLIVSLGDIKNCDNDSCRNSAGEAIRCAQDHNMQEPYLFLLDDCTSIENVVEGLVMGSYKFTDYKQNKAKVTLKSVTIFQSDSGKQTEKLLQQALIIAQGVNFVRDLTNQPANVVNPDKLVDIAKTLAADNNLKCTILQQNQMEKLGMQALLSVAKGSDNMPYLIVLEYNGNDKSKEKLALVGKGVTFDSGGISIKPTEGMGEMKDDMSGSAVVLSSICAIAKLKLPINVVAVLACVENMPSGKAYRPGDIIKSALGKTIEIITTDAEGRLILADAVWYADVKLGASKIIDIATLTGAASIALGDFVSGIITNNQALCDSVITAGKKTGETCWQMPSFKEYKDYYKSDIADLKNSGGRSGGMITGGMFVGEFTDKPWVHIDIGNTVTSKVTKGCNVKGPSGFGLRLLVQTAKELI